MKYNIEHIDWQQELNTKKWNSELKKKIINKDFLPTNRKGEPKISIKLHNTIRRLESQITDDEYMENIISWINYNIGEHILISPCDETLKYWLKVNGLIFCLTFKDEFETNRMFDYGFEVPYIDSKENENFWLEFFSYLQDVANGDFEYEDFLKENWL